MRVHWIDKIRRTGAGTRSAPVRHAHTTLPTPEQATSAPEERATDPEAVARASGPFATAIARLIDQKKVYPRESLHRKEEGKVVVGVTLNRDGSLADVQLEERTPFERLNRAAVETVRAAGRFPPVPEELEAPLQLHIPLLFRVDTQ